MIDLHGRVTTLAGRPSTVPLRTGLLGPPVDGPGDHAEFQMLRALALDPDTGDLYVVDGHAIRRVHRAKHGWRVATVLGNPHYPGFEVDGQQPVPLGRPCLWNPMGLQIRNGQLFIADCDNNAVRMFDLEKRTLLTLVGRLSRRETNYGSVLPYDPGSASASLDHPHRMAIGATGMAEIRWEFRGPDGAVLGTGGPLSPAATATSHSAERTLVSVGGTAPDGTTRVRLIVRLNGTNWGARAEFDLVRFYRASH
jgi:hypothetical protein